MKCETCKKSIAHFEILSDNAVNPTMCEIGELRKLFGFFQYESPNTSSYICNYLPQELHSELLKRMLACWKEESYLFISHNQPIDNYFASIHLLDDELCCCCKRFVCKRKQKDKNTGYKETDFECLLRHMRNAIAHARVFVIHKGNYISLLLEDRNEKGNVSARIICNQADLKKWKNLIKKYGGIINVATD